MRLRPNWVLVIIAALAVISAVSAAILVARSEAEAFTAETPRGATQLYVRAVLEGKVDEAQARLAPQVQCEYDWEFLAATSGTISVLSESEHSNVGEVSVQISERTDLVTVWGHREDFTLERIGDEWFLVGEPWPLYGCEEQNQ